MGQLEVWREESHVRMQTRCEMQHYEFVLVSISFGILREWRDLSSKITPPPLMKMASRNSFEHYKRNYLEILVFAKLEPIQLCLNEWLVLDWIISFW